MSTETNNVTVHEEAKMCTLKERIGHAIGVLGHDSMYTMWSTYITPFLTDILQIPAGVLAILLAVGRVFDGVNDIMMGFIADRTKSNLGRFRPWILRAGPLFCICAMLSFIIPSGNMLVRIIYACVLYIAVDVVFTAVDIPYWSLPAAMTSNTKERSGIVGLTTTASSGISALIGVVVPLCLIRFGGESRWQSYFKTAAIIAAFAIVMYLICFKLVREHVVPDPQQKFSLKLGLRNIYTNKPLLMLQLCNMIFLLAKIVKGYLNYYYCVYNLGNLAVMAVISGISTVAMIAGSLCGTYMSKRIGKKILLFISMALSAAAALVHFLSGWGSLTVIYVCGAVSTFAFGCSGVCTNAMLMDTIEYGEWKTGQRNEGIIQSTRCFVVKCMMAVSGVIVAAIIGLTGYMPLAEVQPDTVLNAFHFMATAFGSILIVAALIPMFFYDLTEKRHAEIMEELKARKAGK